MQIEILSPKASKSAGFLTIMSKSYLSQKCHVLWLSGAYILVMLKESSQPSAKGRHMNVCPPDTCLILIILLLTKIILRVGCLSRNINT